MQTTLHRVRQATVKAHRSLVPRPRTRLVSSNCRKQQQQQQLAQAVATSEASTSTSISLGSWRPGCDIRMLYDGECSLCMKEVNFLKKRDADAGKIDFVDIAAATYRPKDNAGITFQEAMERIHAILPDGTVVRDVEVFRRLYEAVGLGWVYAITKNKVVLDVANAVYGVWAKYRTQITGREALEVILARHRGQQAGDAVAGSLCREEDGSLSQACDLPPTQK